MSIFQLLKASFWPEDGSIYVDDDIYNELKLHQIASLPAPILRNLNMPQELREEWKKYIIHQVANYHHYVFAEASIPITVPYVILKGTSAAKYYPHPEYRSMGDIDIITKRENYDTACRELVDGGYRIIKTEKREICFAKDDYVVELHFQFASLSDVDQAQYLDNLIFTNINSTHVLPDNINGLVILEHIGQHLEDGLGLRQVLDWMMFVDKCLPDEKWPAFESLAKHIGLDKLAIVLTYMCELNLGLPKRKWCSEADEVLCTQLRDYVLGCGNFGYKRKSDQDISENVITYADSFITAFKLLQNRGLINWKAAQRHKVLRPIAWIYQANRYMFRGLNRKGSFSKLKSEYSAAKNRKNMLKALGVRTKREGIMVFQNGKYVKYKGFF